MAGESTSRPSAFFRWWERTRAAAPGMKGYRGMYVAAYTLCYAVLAVVIGVSYTVSGAEPLWKIDGLEQFLPYFIYTGDLIREFFSRLASGQDVSALMWNQSNGYGSDALAVNDTLWNPINWVSAFIPPRYAEYGLVATMFARLYLAGLFFSLYCLYRGRGRFGTLCGALLYAFSATALEVFVWPGGADPLVLFPLLLLGAEQVFDGKSPLLFIASVFLFFFVSYYFSYAACIFLAAYCTVRVFARAHYQRRRVTVREFLGWTGRFAGYLLVGLACAAVSLAPQIVALLDTDRAFDTRSTIDILYSPNNYLSWLAGFVGHSSAGSDCAIGYTGVGLVAVAMLFCERKKHRALAVTFVVLCLCLLLPYAGAFFNGMNYATNRWVWAFSFCIAYIAAAMLPSIRACEKRHRVIVLIVCAAYAALILLIPATRNETNVVALCGLALFLVAAFGSVRMREFPHRVAALSALIACLAVCCFYVCSASTWGKAYEAAGLGTGYEKLAENTPNSVVAEIDDDSWWRYDADPKPSYGSWVRTRNSSLVLGLRGIDFYNSIYNSRIDDYHTELGVTGNGMNFSYDNLGGRSMLLLLNNVKYYLKQLEGGMNRCYNYDDASRIANTGMVAGAQCGAIEGNLTLPLGYTYDSEISRSTYDTLTPLQKQQALMQGAVVSDETAAESALPETSLSFSDVDIPYSIVETSGVRMVEDEDGTAFVAERADASITLSIEGVPSSETYLELTGLTYKAMSQYDLMSEEEKAALDWSEKTADELKELQFNGPKYYSVRASSDQSTSIRSISNYIESMHVYGGKTDWDLCLGYSDEAPSTITISFSAAGRFSYTELAVKAQPMASFTDQAVQRAACTMQDAHVDGGKVSGTIDLASAQRLYFSIPWSQGWKAYVDGEEVEIDLTNTAFMSLAIEEGTHVVELRYSTPGLLVGAMISICGIAALLMLFIFQKHRRTRRRSEACLKLRSEKIAARDALSPEERAAASKAISIRTATLSEYLQAETILIYRAVKGEVQLDALARAACEAGKRVAYPRCSSNSEMHAYLPNDVNAWEEGKFGIWEPRPEQSTLVSPEEIDLVVCPCTSFDASCHRLGMGGGYYDRYLPQCTHAAIVAVAFEVQKCDKIPVQPWDYSMDCVITEAGEYR